MKKKIATLIRNDPFFFGLCNYLSYDLDVLNCFKVCHYYEITAHWEFPLQLTSHGMFTSLRDHWMVNTTYTIAHILTACALHWTHRDGKFGFPKMCKQQKQSCCELCPEDLHKMLLRSVLILLLSTKCPSARGKVPFKLIVQFRKKYVCKE